MEIINTIQNMKDKGVFKNYINYIAFPYYKNIEENTKLNFDFPFTVFVGKNGSGKSSALRAMYGVPKGKSCGDFWFSTDVDPISEANNQGKRNCFYYGYSVDKNSTDAQVLKQRMIRENDPDYWETSDPVLKLGMKRGKRNPPVEKNVVYLDFRGEISAFDKYFYFDKPKEGKKQDFLRKKSKYLKRAFENLPLKYPGNFTSNIYEKPIDLDKQYLDKVNYILGKNYKKIRILNHRLYGRWGTSVLLKSQYNLNYSEANAGSGEIAVVQLVKQLLDAPNFSLILLDEPEVSLHPAAQKRMQLFMLDQIKEKKHQVIISTHSSILIEDLPNNAIKLFIDNKNGKFKVCENINYNEAFYDLEERVFDKKRIICEDFSAKVLIERILHTMNISQHFQVDYCHGGAESIIKKYVPIYSTEEHDKTSFLVLDGDKYHKPINIDDLQNKDHTDAEKLKKYIFEVYGMDVPTYIDGGEGGGRTDQKCTIYLKYLSYQQNNIYYLPDGKIPEQIILKSEYVNNRYSDICNRYTPITTLNAKCVIVDISKKRGDLSVNSTIEALTTEVIAENSVAEISFIKEFLDQIYNCNNELSKIAL